MREWLIADNKYYGYDDEHVPFLYLPFFIEKKGYNLHIDSMILYGWETWDILVYS